MEKGLEVDLHSVNLLFWDLVSIQEKVLLTDLVCCLGKFFLLM